MGGDGGGRMVDDAAAAVGLDASIRLVDCCVYWCWCCGTAAFVINWLPRMLML